MGLALVPLALVAYVVAQRRRRRFAVRYTNVDVLASVAARVGWTRHIPALLALLALVALLIALGAAGAHGGGRAAAGDGGDGHRHLGLDVRQRRQARTA